MKRSLLFGMVLATALAGCGRKSAAPLETYLYCPVDTLWQSLPTYQITSDSRFPYGKFHSMEKMTEAEYRDGLAVICLRIDRPTTVMVMPVRDSTVQMCWSGNFFLLPGDSLELRSEPDTTLKGFTSMRPLLRETERMDNRFEAMLTAAFPYKDRPKVVDGDLARYKADMTAYYRRRADFLDSCRMRMTLSPEYVARFEALAQVDLYNDLCRSLDEHPDAEAPADYLVEIDLPEHLTGTPAYVTALINKYIEHAGADPASNFDRIYAGIRKAPRRLRDQLTALMIGYYAGEECSAYRQQLLDAIAQARQSIADTACLEYIDRAANFYERCGTALPDEVSKIEMQPYDGTQKLTLGEMLAQFEGRPVYLDFWSSWCFGCIIDIMNSAEAHACLAQENVAYVCISIDKDADAWRKAAEQYKVTENSYLIDGEFDSPLCTYFEIESIPRYILLDSQHRIASSDAPRPVKQELADLQRKVRRMR